MREDHLSCCRPRGCITHGECITYRHLLHRVWPGDKYWVGFLQCMGINHDPRASLRLSSRTMDDFSNDTLFVGVACPHTQRKVLST